MSNSCMWWPYQSLTCVNHCNETNHLQNMCKVMSCVFFLDYLLCSNLPRPRGEEWQILWGCRGLSVNILRIGVGLIFVYLQSCAFGCQVERLGQASRLEPLIVTYLMWDDFYVCRAVPFATMWEAGASHRTWAMYYFLTWGLFVCVFAGLFLWLPCRRLGQTTDKPCITSWPWGGCFLCLQGCSFGYRVGGWGKPLYYFLTFGLFVCVCVFACRAVHLATM